MPYVKLVGTKNPNVNWATSVVLERDDDGNVTKEVVSGVPINLESAEQSKVEAMGFVLESSSKDEAEKVQESTPAAGSDVSGAAPVFGSGAESRASDEKSKSK